MVETAVGCNPGIQFLLLEQGDRADTSIAGRVRRPVRIASPEFREHLEKEITKL